MKSLRLAARALREDARSRSHPWLRAALVAVLLTILVFAHDRSAWLSAPGRFLFTGLVWTNFWFVSILCPAMFAAVITEEKENRTLGLLELAGFSAPALLLGKSLGELTAATLLLFVQVPFAMLTVTLGGVAPHQVWAAFATLAAYVLFIYGIALLGSVVSLHTAAATRLTALILFGATFGPWFIGRARLWTGAGSGGGPIWLDEIVAVSALNALDRIDTTGYAEPLLSPAVVANLAAGLGLAFLAALLFPRSARQDVAPAPTRGLWRRRRPGGRGRPAPGPAAVEWKEFALRGGAFTIVWKVVALLAMLTAVAACTRPMTSGRDWARTALVTSIPWVLLAFVLDAGTSAGRLFRHEVQWRTLPSLFVLPMELRSLCWAKLRGALRLLLPTLVTLSVVLLVGLYVFLEEMTGFRSGEDVAMLFSIVTEIAGTVLFGLHLTAWLSLRVRRGAFAIALVTCILGNMLLLSCLIMSLRGSTDETLIAFLLFSVGGVLVTLCIPLRRAIAARLREHAAR